RGRVRLRPGGRRYATRPRAPPLPPRLRGRGRWGVRGRRWLGGVGGSVQPARGHVGREGAMMYQRMRMFAGLALLAGAAAGLAGPAPAGKGKSEPAEVPLALRLVANRTSYPLDL